MTTQHNPYFDRFTSPPDPTPQQIAARAAEVRRENGEPPPQPACPCCWGTVVGDACINCGAIVATCCEGGRG